MRYINKHNAKQKKICPSAKNTNFVIIAKMKKNMRTKIREEPSEFMIKALKEAEKSPLSPTFDNVKDAITWLQKESKKYEKGKFS